LPGEPQAGQEGEEATCQPPRQLAASCSHPCHQLVPLSSFVSHLGAGQSPDGKVEEWTSTHARMLFSSIFSPRLGKRHLLVFTGPGRRPRDKLWHHPLFSKFPVASQSGCWPLPAWLCDLFGSSPTSMEMTQPWVRTLTCTDTHASSILVPGSLHR